MSSFFSRRNFLEAVGVISLTGVAGYQQQHISSINLLQSSPPVGDGVTGSATGDGISVNQTTELENFRGTLTTAVRFPGDGFIAAGYKKNGLGLAVKADSRGNIEWTRSYQNELGPGYITGIASDGGSGHYLTGTDSEGQQGWVIRIGEDGRPRYNRTYAPGRDTGYRLQDGFSTDHGFLAVGKRESHQNHRDSIWLLALEDQGNVRWNRFYGRNISLVSSATKTKNGLILSGIGISNTAWLWKITDGTIDWKTNLRPSLASVTELLATEKKILIGGSYPLSMSVNTSRIFSAWFDETGKNISAYSWGKKGEIYSFTSLGDSEGGKFIFGISKGKKDGVRNWLALTADSGHIIDWKQIDITPKSIIDVGDEGHIVVGSAENNNIFMKIMIS